MFKNFVLGFYKVDNFISIGIYIKETIPLRTDIFKIYISYGVCYLSLKQIVIRIEFDRNLLFLLCILLNARIDIQYCLYLRV